jgi:protocatechuate 3,4-dioxygenase beta subunit
MTRTTVAGRTAFCRLGLSSFVFIAAIAQELTTGSRLDSAAAPGRLTASITGKVYGLGSPLEGATVRVRRESHIISAPDPNEAEYVATSGPGGIYKIDGIVAGHFRVYADMPAWTRRFHGALGDGPSQGQLLRIQDGSKIQGIDVELLPQGKISGKVLDADGRPVADLVVSALGSNYVGSRKFMFPMQTAETDADGNYFIRGLPPGAYLVRAEHNLDFRIAGAHRNGERSPVKSLVRSTYHPASPFADGAIPLDIRPGSDVKNVDIQVSSVESFRICGTVDQRDIAVPNFLVMALVTTELDVKATLRPNLARVQRDGGFCFDEVTPGRYFLEPARSYVSRKENSGVTGSTEVFIKSADSGPLKFVARAPFSIDGQVMVAVDPAPRGTHNDPALWSRGADSADRQAVSGKEGAQVPPPPGPASSPASGGSKGTSSADASKPAASSGEPGAAVGSASSGADPASERQGLSVAAASTGAASKKGESNVLAKIQVELAPMGRLLVNAPKGLTDRDGLFRLENVPVAKYAVQLRNLPEGHYVQSITFNGQELIDSEFEPMAGGTIQVVLATGAKTVDGIAQDGKGVAVPGAIISLWVDDGKYPDSRPVRKTVADSSGHFQFTNLSPGRYRALASPDGIEPSMAISPRFCRAFERSATAVAMDRSQTSRGESLVLSVVPLELIRSGGW